MKDYKKIALEILLTVDGTHNPDTIRFVETALEIAYLSGKTDQLKEDMETYK